MPPEGRRIMLLVLGTHRSGTSVITRMLECLGARPSARLHPPLPNNPKGFFEDVDVQRFNEYELLPAVGSRWHHLAPVDWSVLDPSLQSRLGARAADILLANFAPDAPLSVLKDPRMCTLLPFWLAVLDRAGFDTRFVCAVRDPLSVARSLEARDGLSLAHGAMLYASNWLSVHHPWDDRPVAYASYDALLDEPARELDRVAQALGLAKPADFAERIDRARAEFLDPSLRHGTGTAESMSRERDLPPLAIAVHRCLAAAAAGDAASARLARAAIADLHAQVAPVVPLLRDHDRLYAEHQAVRGERANLANEVSQLRTLLEGSEANRLRLADEALAAARQAERRDAETFALRMRAAQLEGMIASFERSLSWRMTAPVRRLARGLATLPWIQRRDLRAIRRSGLFDPVFYALQLPPGSRGAVDPLRHYLDHGAAAGLDPSPSFDSSHYLETYPDIRAAGINPLLHYIRHGRREGRTPHPNAPGPVRETHLETPLSRQVRLIRESGHFDTAYYLERNPDVRADGTDPATHYVLHGWKEGCDPSARFDTRFYLREYLHDDLQGEDPLSHFLRVGFRAGCCPSKEYRTEALRQRATTTLARLLRGPADLRKGIRQFGGVVGSLGRAIELLRIGGPGRLVHGIREQLRGPAGAGAAATGPSPSEPAVRVADGVAPMAERIPGSCRILFIGCDGLVAGSQILLLSLERWLRAHTSVEMGTILLGGGELVRPYGACGPVIVWPELVQRIPDPAARREHLRSLFGGFDLIYGNTVVAASIYRELEPLGVPVLSHIHELERSIRSYVSGSAVEALKSQTRQFIGCSAPVAANLEANHAVPPERIRTVHAFIPSHASRGDSPGPARLALRDSLGIPRDARVVVGCGTIYWRKGVDLFVQTAIRMKAQGGPVPLFLWIGTQYWDLDGPSRELMSWKAIEDLIDAHGLRDRIRFLGERSNPRDHFRAADVFFLPSREDPFPLVCLEAAQDGTPTVCFAEAGGIPDFVSDDAGIVVPHLDVDAAARAIRSLVDDPERRDRLGRQAAEKVARRHVDDVAMPEILAEIHRTAGTAPLVSVIVPVYNQAPFLERRLESILGQTFRDVEIIILDDASTDASLEVARRYGQLPNVRIVANDRNSGSAFRQWAKGLGLARGRLIWIAEGDDASEPDFLEQVLPSLADPSVALAYADSTIVDGDDRPIGTYRDYYAPLDGPHWMMDRRVPAALEVNQGLGVKNTIPNASAVVFRRELATPEVLERVSSMRFAGDWLFWLQVAQGRSIAFRSLPLNRHRKHAATLTHASNHDPTRTQALLEEVREIHEWVLANCPVNASFRRRLAVYLAAQVDALFPDARAAGDESRYPITRMLEAADAAVARTAAVRRRVTFITTNDWSHDGGSEQLWIHAALAMAKAGHAVQAVIRRWSPEPYFLAEFRTHGVETVFKDASPEAAVAAFAPDLVVINIGDQDEGTEWYDTCRGLGLPYLIVNHLTKEPRRWPIRPELQERVRIGNLDAAAVLFTSRNNRSLMERRLGVAIPRAGLFHNPLFLDRARLLPFPPVDGPIRLAMPARLLDIHKGQGLAIEVFAMEKWRARPIELHLYGKGPDEDALRGLVERHGLANVHFHEPRWELPHPDLAGIWRDCHGLLMTSYMEGMPLTLLNAMCHGRVPIVTDIGGHREVVADGVSGFLAAEPTPEAVDEALERAWKGLAEWESIGRRAREHMLAFAPEDPVADLVEKLLMVIEGRGPGRPQP
jgi:glycosyltransferase involved in cell wall biosynthesis